VNVYWLSLLRDFTDGLCFNTVNDSSIWRVLDVNANRAAEGLRTIEDVARLIREDSVASLWAKSLRHDLAAAIAKFDRSLRLAARSTETDAGTGHTTGTESVRADWKAVISAACERVGQSLRCLEEFSKLVDESIGVEFKTLRYRAYDVLAQLELRLLRDSISKSANLYLLIDCSLPIDQFAIAVRQYAEAGADFLQLRDKSCDGRRLVTYARAAAQSLAGTDSKLIINDRVDVALASGAAGVHLGQEDMAYADARRIAGADLLIGISTHSIEQALEAEIAGADYIGCGPTFPSKTKPFDAFPGTQFLSQVAKRISIPAFAIGGIDASNLHEVLQTGCTRVALSSAVHLCANPIATLLSIKSSL
jgi:thiamine-phosphate pyrophosphorylase